MQKKLFRILSVFLTVVIVSVMFMSPMVYANQVVIGGGLVLLVAGLLIMCGMTFTSQAQAESVSQHTISVMPSWLLETLSGFVGGADPNGDKKPTYQMYKNGFATAVSISSAAWIAFKMWFDEYFGVDDEVWNGGGGSGVANFEISHDGMLSYPFVLTNITNISNTVRYMYTVDISGFRIQSDLSVAWMESYTNEKGYVVTRGYDSKGIAFDNASTLPQSTPIDFLVYYPKALSGDQVFVSSSYGSSFHTSWASVGIFASTTVGMLQDAWQEAQAYQGDISVGIPSDMAEMIEKPYNEIANADSLDGWDWKKDLDDLAGLVGNVCADLGILDGYDALLEQTQGLKDALDRLRETVDVGADVIGGVKPLDEAMYDAGVVIPGLRDLIEELEKDKTVPIPLDRIRDLEDEIEKAKEAIDELTKAGDKDIPTDPPIVVPSTGAINWAPLASIKGFSGVFPFCIPFDIINMIKSLNVAPEAPIFEIPFKIQGLFDEKILVDLSVMNPIMPFVRLFILLAFAIALARFSSSVIKW